MRSTLTAVFLSVFLMACAGSQKRLTPGEFDTDPNALVVSGEVSQVVAMGQEARPGTEFLLTALSLVAADAIFDPDNLLEEIATDLVGFEVGESVALAVDGAPIYQLTLSGEEGQQRIVYVRGGNFRQGDTVKYTLRKNRVTSISKASSLG